MTRLPERDRRDVYLRRRGEAALDAYGEPLARWGPPVLMRPIAQPAASVLDMQMYGERVKRMLRLYYDGDIKMREGDGLCIDVSRDQAPDYLVVSAMRWDQWELDVERQTGDAQPERAEPAEPVTEPEGDDGW